MAEAVRPRRQRTASSRVRTFDLETRNQIKRKRLDSLEADNWHESRAKEEEEDDDYNPMDDDESGDEVAVDARKKSKKKKAKKEGWNAMQKCKSLRGDPRRGRRQFCSVSGLMGKYKCPVTGDYLATLEAYETHRETRLKGLI
ncbi:hypothetical protein Ctob_012001 [Chrysochromulina tobinii]|uniref:Vps72/YL1 C-terminal domain-containing protein n=1 Tax=Chrysochromulina tobinii TaxID=1460289 RepID=A0A0M0JFX4_9EUKA|nr:hypothetical protein Ctob_012001 [Chrysochromulina tobinii]|eukprot:KOO25464.1 hypothetical protein Ctob_012001 [Chrysochromulina sp. CCMP291]